MDDSLIQKFGFSEMYEWADIQSGHNQLGRFVTFDKKSTEKIVLYGFNKDAEIIGITTICSVADSDNPDEWKYAYMCNEYGDVFLQKEKLAVGEKTYDQYNELAYIKTRPWEHYIRIPNKAYDSSKKYAKRSNRREWVRVNLMGKVIVEDNGECVPGSYCTPYVGKLVEKFGTAIPSTDNSNQKKYYVLSRLTDKTILILNR